MIYVKTVIKAAVADARNDLPLQTDPKTSPNFLSLGEDWWEFKVEIIEAAIDYWFRVGKKATLYREDPQGFIVPTEWNGDVSEY